MAAERTSDGSGVRVLLVEGDATHRILTTRLLERLGATVQGETAVAAAVALAATVPFGAVLLDLRLAGVSAGDAAQLIRARQQALTGAEVTVVGLGAAGEDVPAGFDAVLAKPVVAGDLARALARAAPAAVTRPRSPDGASIRAPVLDHDVLLRLTDDLGDREMVRSTIRLYLDELPLRLASLRVDTDAGDLAAVRRTAHSLKSASAMLGALAMARECLAVEQAAATGSLPPDLVVAVTSQAQRVAPAMTEFLSR